MIVSQDASAVWASLPLPDAAVITAGVVGRIKDPVAGRGQNVPDFKSLAVVQAMTVLRGAALEDDPHPGGARAGWLS